MFKLLIVEDEPLIRAGLKHYFAWEELGVTTLLEAENGKAGMALALDQRPDLIVTDIRMPEMDGMEMIAKLSPELPGTAFIILTGYNEFAYAQQAIRLGVVHDFLIKPLIYEESLKTIVACLSKLKAAREESERRDRLEKDAAESKNLLGAELVKRMLDDSGSLDDRAIRDACGFPSDRYAYLPFAMSAIPRSLPLRRSGLRANAESLIAEAAKLAFPSARHREVFFCYDKTKLYALAVADEIGEPANAAYADRLNEKLRETSFGLPYSLYLAIGTPIDDLPSIDGLFRRTEKALYQRFFQPDRYAFALSPAAGPASFHKESHYRLDESDKLRLLRDLENGDFAGTTELMRRLAKETAEKSPSASPDRFLAYVQELVNLAIRFAHKNDIPVNGVYSDKALSLACVDDFATIDALFDWLADWMNHLSEVIGERGRSNANPDQRIFEKIEKFIQANIDQEITLQTVADRFFYNPSYLSRLFKTRLNKNYMAFVTEIRMEYAKQCLLQPKLMVADVCAMCGYKSYKHFVQTFKRVTNMSPTDYRNRLRS